MQELNTPTKIKIEKIPDKFGTVIYMTRGEESNYVAFEKEIDFDTMRHLQEAIQLLLREMVDGN